MRSSDRERFSEILSEIFREIFRGDIEGMEGRRGGEEEGGGGQREKTKDHSQRFGKKSSKTLLTETSFSPNCRSSRLWRPRPPPVTPRVSPGRDPAATPGRQPSDDTLAPCHPHARSDGSLAILPPNPDLRRPFFCFGFWFDAATSARLPESVQCERPCSAVKEPRGRLRPRGS